MGFSISASGQVCPSRAAKFCAIVMFCLSVSMIAPFTPTAPVRKLETKSTAAFVCAMSVAPSITSVVVYVAGSDLALSHLARTIPSLYSPTVLVRAVEPGLYDAVIPPSTYTRPLFVTVIMPKPF